MRLCLLLFTLVAAAATATVATAEAKERPNILFILADDLGSSDLGCYGSKLFETPNLDRLAAEGIRFTQAYSPAPICSASRAATLTGKTTAQTGFEFVTKNEPGFQSLQAPLRAPAFTMNLALEETTFAEALKPAGYETAFFGKWHLNQHYERYLGWSPTHGPPNHGFTVAEEDFGNHPYSYWKQRKDRTFLPMEDGFFPHDSLTERAIEFVTADHESPFFCMLSHFYVHDPVHTRMEWLYDDYLSRIEESHPRRELLAKYGAMVTTLDHHVGEILKALDDSGKRSDTLIVFTSDNGGHPNYAGNAPLRGSKWNLYEGGIRVPMIANWQGTIHPNTTSEHPVSSLDLYPTFCELAKVEATEQIIGSALTGLFSENNTSPPKRDHFWHFPYYHPETKFDQAPGSIGIDDGYTSQTRPQSAIRSGDWKLIYFYEDERSELYHLAEDLSEQNDLSSSDPERTNDLKARLFNHLERSGARLPTPHPDFSSQ